MNTDQSLWESEELSERVESKQKVEFVLFGSSNERIKMQTKCSKEWARGDRIGHNFRGESLLNRNNMEDGAHPVVLQVVNVG